MKPFPFLLLAICIILSLQACTEQASIRLSFPETKKEDVTENYHGTEVTDPYRWMEDVESDDVQTWLESQKEVASAYFGATTSRESIKTRIRQNWDFQKFYVPKRHRGYYWYFYNEGLKEYPSLFRKRGIDTEDELLVDPMELSDDTTLSVTSFYPSEYSDYVAYTVNIEGSDWEEIEILNTRSMEPVDEILEWVKFTTIAWTGSGNGFYYTRYEAPPEGEEYTALNLDQQIFYHKVGTEQDRDTQVDIPGAEENWMYKLTTTNDGRYLIIQIYEGFSATNRIYYRDIVQQSKVIKLIDSNDAAYDFVDSEGPLFYFRTTKNAARGKLVAINIGDPRQNNIREIIPQSEDVLHKAVMARGQYGQVFVAHYLKNATSKLAVFNKDGKPDQEISLPAPGSVSDLTGYRRESNVFFSFSSFAWPATIFLFDAQTGKLHEYQRPKTDINAEAFIVDQQFVVSSDGTPVPALIVKKRGLSGGRSAKDKLKKRPAGLPTIMHANGHFGNIVAPSFSPEIFSWLEAGGAFVLVNARGGGELGAEWHAAGKLDKKVNTYNDVIASAEFLTQKGFTSASKLAISGQASGALTAAAVVTKRPELFKAMVGSSGMYDLIRYGQFTIGWAAEQEFGLVDEAEQFPSLMLHSPFQSIKDGIQYPSALLQVSTTDDRVVPFHSYKFAARLQNSGTAYPVVLRASSGAHPDFGFSASRQIEAYADQIAFLASELELSGF